MEVFVAALIFIGISVFFMCFNIIFRKGKSFPDGEIGHNKELRKKGIICAKEEEIKLWKKGVKHSAAGCDDFSCASCSEVCFEKENKKKGAN